MHWEKVKSYAIFSDINIMLKIFKRTQWSTNYKTEYVKIANGDCLASGEVIFVQVLGRETLLLGSG